MKNIPRSENLSTAGFTLSELLVTLFILSLVLVVLTAAMSFGFNRWERTKTQQSELFRTEAVRLFLGEQLANIYPLEDGASPANAHLNFEGRRRSLSYVAISPLRYGEQPVSASLRVSSEGQLLFEWRVLGSVVQNLPRDEAVLLEHMSSAVFDYFDGSRGEWRTEWLRREELPSAIRLRSSAGEAPALIVRPRIDIDGSCIIDLISGRCRGR